MAKAILKNFLVSLFVSSICVTLQTLLRSEVFVVFLKNNIITIEIAMLAINSATLGIVLTKVREIIDRFPHESDFSCSEKQMSLSITEQIGLIAFSSLVLILIGSDVINELQNNIIDLSLEVLLIACFVYDVRVLKDIARSIFVLLDFKSHKYQQSCNDRVLNRPKDINPKKHQ